MIEEEKYNCKYSKKFGISWLLLITIFLLRNIYIYSKFESMGMKKDESFSKFCIKLSYSSINLGKRTLESKVVRKILRSLLSRFRLKVITKETKNKNVNTLRVDELVKSFYLQRSQKI